MTDPELEQYASDLRILQRDDDALAKALGGKKTKTKANAMAKAKMTLDGLGLGL